MKKWFYNFKRTNLWFIFSIALAAFLFTTSMTIFIEMASTLPLGIASFVKMFNYIFPETSKYFSIIYLLFNVPLLIFFYNKIKRSFFLKTMLFFAFQIAFGIIFSFLPINKIVYYIVPISEMKQMSLGEQKVYILEKIWPIFIFSIFGSLLSSVAISLCWKIGGSMGGTEIINYYFATKKQLAIGSIFKLINGSFCVFSFIVTMIFKNSLRQYAFLLLFMTIFNIFFQGFLIDILYPKYSKVQIEVHSNKIKKIDEALKSSKYIHPHSIVPFISGYHQAQKKKIISIMYLYEKNAFIKLVSSIDPDVWINEIHVTNIYGSLDTKNIEN